MKKDILHLKAPGNWINDPNGFIYFKGKYHLFYQYFPYAPVWGTMHWGHAVSEDLIHWEHLGIALFPTKAYDQNGVFSGSAIEKDGKLYLYYSGVRYLETDEENIHTAYKDRYETCQTMIVSKDGDRFDNWKDKKKIIPVIMDEKIANRTHTRDPKVWQDKDCYYMALGSTYEEQEGRVLFFRSRDAKNWEYANQYQSEQFGKILECPDIFQVNGSYVFMGSPMYAAQDGLEYAHYAVCGLAQFSTVTCDMCLTGESRLVDYGMDLYAPQTNVDKEGRRVMIGWMRMPKAVENGGEKPWNGMMCLPRVVEVVEGQIYFRVHPEVDRYFEREIPKEELNDGRISIPKENGRAVPYRLRARLKEGESLDIGGYRLWLWEDTVRADRSKVYGKLRGYRLTGSTPKLGGRCELDIFVDGNLLEVFINEGQYVLSHVVYGLGDEVKGRVDHVYVGE
jgi:Beta-fructosidases (levanase/invertase)